MEDITWTYTLTEDQFVRAQQQLLLKPTLVGILLGCAIIVPIASRVVSPWVILAVAVAVVAILPFSIRRNLRKTYRSQKTLSAPITMTLSGDGVQVTSQYENTSLPYGTLFAWRQIKDTLLIYLAINQAFFVPLASCTPEQLESALAHLAAVPEYKTVKAVRQQKRTITLALALVVAGSLALMALRLLRS